MKRFKFMAGVLLIALCVGSVFAQNEADFETDGNGTITKYTGWDTVIVIPASIGGKPVTGIGEGAFSRINLTGVTIPATVKTIGDNAFSGNKLTNVVIPAGVTSIGSRAFSGNQLTGVTIPATVKTIGDNAFADNKLTNVVIPEGVTDIGEVAFDGNQLARLTLPGSIIQIGRNAFGSTSRRIPTITLGASIDADLAFIDTDSTYGRAPNIFYDYISNSRKAGTYTYREQDSNAWATRGSGRKRTADGFEYIQTQYGIVITGYNGSGANALRIPERINNLPVRAILELRGRSITRVLIPNSVTYIGDDAFSSNKLTNVTIPDSVTYIGNNAFSSNKLTSVIIPDNVTYIGDDAFSSNQLTSVTMPANVSIAARSGSRSGYGSFGNEGLENLYNNNGKKAGTYTKDGNGWTYQP